MTTPEEEAALRRHGDAVRRGKAAQAAGRRVEEWIDWSCKRLAQEGRAWIRKTEPAVGFGQAGAVRRGAGGRWGIDRRGGVFFRSSAPPDYMGFLSGGRGVCFDLKSTQERAWEWKIRKGDAREAFRHVRTKERQVEDLDAAGKFGALSGLVVVLQSSAPTPLCVWVPHRSVRLVSAGRWDRTLFVEEAGAALADWPAGGDPRWLDAALRADAVAQIASAAVAAEAVRRHLT